MPKRLRSLKDDPLRPVLELEPDLVSALERLAERMGGEPRDARKAKRGR
jgi:hypothetical protein